MKKFLTIFIPCLIVAGMIGYIVWRESKARELKDALVKQIEVLRSVVESKSDSLSTYETLVDQYQYNEKKLRTDLEKINSDYANEIKATKSRILSITSMNLALKNQLDTLRVKFTMLDGVLTANIKDYYPDDKNPFVTYFGTIQMPVTGATDDVVIAREFVFSPLKVNSILTERDNGSWSVRFDAPNFIEVGDVRVNSLPAKQYIPSKPRIKLVLGAGVDVIYNVGPVLHLSGGAAWGDWMILGSAGLQSAGFTLAKTFTR